MKKIISIVLTLIVLVSVNYFLSEILNTDFIELFALVGLISTIITRFFTSEGAKIISYLDIKNQNLTSNDKINGNYFTKYHNNIPFIVSLLYTLIGIIMIVINY